MKNQSSSSAYNFADHVISCQRKQGSVLVCGLDPEPTDIPKFLFCRYRHLAHDPFKWMGKVITEFNLRIIEAVAPYVCGFKPQAAFYERYLSPGWEALEETRRMVAGIKLSCTADTKRNDGGPTATAYTGLLTDVPVPIFKDGSVTFGEVPGINFDCITVNPLIDEAQMQPFLAKVKPVGKGLQVVTKTSFKPESRIEEFMTDNGLKVWERVAEFVRVWSEGTEGKEGYRTIGVVLGATREKDADKMREILPNNLFLIPGYGAQGGGAKGAVRSFNKDGFGGMVNSSRGILYAYKTVEYARNEEDFDHAAAQAARDSRDELNKALEQRIKELE